MSQLIKIDEEYANWIQNVGARFKNMQIKAATKVNQEMLRFYWSLGKDMTEILPQLVAKIDSSEITPQVVAKTDDNEISPQLV